MMPHIIDNIDSVTVTESILSMLTCMHTIAQPGNFLYTPSLPNTNTGIERTNCCFVRVKTFSLRIGYCERPPLTPAAILPYNSLALVHILYCFVYCGAGLYP